MRRVRVIDSHTEGEPTRVVVEGVEGLERGSVAERAAEFRARWDWLRSGIVNEPRGSDAVVGALLMPASGPRAVTGVVFFNNVGLLHACGHGTIGVAATLRHMGRIGVGSHTVETPVGEVGVTIGADGAISIDNVASYRHVKAQRVNVPGIGEVSGDVAWGGNWFFLIESHGLRLDLSNLATLTDYTLRVRRALAAAGITGANGQEIDHVELFGPAQRADCHSRNFVMCPGGAYDRSPCGTGTSAKMACLYADGKLAPGEVWKQESIIGSAFSGRVRAEQGKLIPTISGAAWITAESTLLFDDTDPFAGGIRVS